MYIGSGANKFRGTRRRRRSASGGGGFKPRRWPTADGRRQTDGRGGRPSRDLAKRVRARARTRAHAQIDESGDQETKQRSARAPTATHNDTTKPRTSRRRVARARAVLTRTILRGEEIETNDAREEVARAVRSDVGRARASPHASSVGAAAAAAAAIACRAGARVRVSKRPSAARARERRS